MDRAAVMARRQAIRRERAVAARGGVNASVMIVTTMRNEGPFILEWVAHHRSIGIEGFTVYTNDCDDGTDRLLDVLAAKGIITAHLPNPFEATRKGNPQRAALRDAQRQDAVKAADWVIPMDVDEFINIHVGDGQFQTMLDTVPDANMISMTWRLFGNGFVTQYEDRFVTEQFTRCIHEKARRPHQAWGFKTAFRDLGIYSLFSVHRPKMLDEQRAAEVNWVDSNGQPMRHAMLASGWRASVHNWGYGMVSLNHYSLRSTESYLVKKERGRVNHVDRDQGLAYWFRMNHNGDEDTSIQARVPAAKAEFARLMDDPEIRWAHLECVAAHRSKIGMLKTIPEYRDLMAEVESPRMQSLSRMTDRFSNAIFAEGPGAVSPDVLEEADEKGFQDV
jgi:hypothetical protein